MVGLFYFCYYEAVAKKILIILVLVILGATLYTAYIMETQPLAGYETKIIRMGNSELEVLVADTEEKRTKGLMGVTKLTTDTGMLFIFPDSSPRTFWNKNTLIPLDLIWISNGNVVDISSLPSISQSNNQIISVPSSEAIDMVLEVNAGWVEAHGVEIGTAVHTK